jgi:hypothetical protein
MISPPGFAFLYSGADEIATTEFRAAGENLQPN